MLIELMKDSKPHIKAHSHTASEIPSFISFFSFQSVVIAAGHRIYGHCGCHLQFATVMREFSERFKPIVSYNVPCTQSLTGHPSVVGVNAQQRDIKCMGTFDL